jgi:hypothetical protein
MGEQEAASDSRGYRGERWAAAMWCLTRFYPTEKIATWTGSRSGLTACFPPPQTIGTSVTQQAKP